MLDTIVIGGGPAGLQAALTLGRMHRSVLLLDSGTYRNATVEHAHNYATHDGIAPAEFRRLARADIAAYDTVEVRETRAERVEPDGDGFAVHLDGTVERAAALVLATGVRDALRTTPAPVVGLSPIVGGSHVRGMAQQMLTSIGVEVSAAGVGLHYGDRRSADGVLDGWLVDERDAEQVERVRAAGLACAAVPLMMTDVEATAAMAAAAVALVTGAGSVDGER